MRLVVLQRARSGEYPVPVWSGLSSGSDAHHLNRSSVTPPSYVHIPHRTRKTKNMIPRKRVSEEERVNVGRNIGERDRERESKRESKRER